ncbi:MAG TPA: YfdQ family protein [Xylella fastidiosa subsp. pauca]
MDKTAIEHIQQTAIDANKFRLPRALQDIAVAIPDNYDIRNLESLYTLRSRFRGEMKTQSITDFVQYIKTKGNGEGFINAENLSAKIFFNLGTTESPGHGDWTATLTLNPTAAYKALLDIDGKTLNQRKLIDFLEDWAPLLSATSQESLDELPLTTAINAIRKLTIKKTSESESTQGEFNTSRSKFDDIEAKSSLGLPIGFTLTTKPYLGLPERRFLLRLSVFTDEEKEKPLITLRLIQREAQQEAIAQDFKSVLFRQLEGHATLTIGTFSPSL